MKSRMRKFFRDDLKKLDKLIRCNVRNTKIFIYIIGRKKGNK